MIELNAISNSVSSPVSAKPEVPVTKPGVSNKAPGKATGEQAKVSEESVRHAVQQANIEFTGSNQKVGFGYEARLGQLYVQVLDKETGSVVKEIPSRDFIEHQAFMKELAGLILDRNA